MDTLRHILRFTSWKMSKFKLKKEQFCLLLEFWPRLGESLKFLQR